MIGSRCNRLDVLQANRNFRLALAVGTPSNHPAILEQGQRVDITRRDSNRVGQIKQPASPWVEQTTTPSL